MRWGSAAQWGRSSQDQPSIVYAVILRCVAVIDNGDTMKIFVNFFFFLAALGAALMLSGVADHVPGSETVGWGSVGFSLLLAIVLFGLTDEENPLVREMEPLDDDE